MWFIKFPNQTHSQTQNVLTMRGENRKQEEHDDIDDQMLQTHAYYASQTLPNLIPTTSIYLKTKVVPTQHYPASEPTTSRQRLGIFALGNTCADDG